MTIQRSIGYSFFVGCSVVAIACGSGAEPSSSAPAAETTAPAPSPSSAEPKSTPLFSLAIEDGHKVDFYELANGRPFVGESAREFQVPVLGKAGKATSLADVYRAIKPGSDVPAELLEADKRVAARPLIHDTSEPPASGASAGSGPKLYTSGEQTWFKDTLCNASAPGGVASNYGTTNVVQCLQGWSWANSGWVKGGVFQSQSWVGSEAGQDASFQLNFWNNGSQTLLNVFVAPGTYYWTYAPGNGFTGNQFYWYNASLFNAGANTQVSQAVEDCGENNQWSCGADCGSGQGCDESSTTDCEIVGVGNGICVSF
jgi:hypothetical protein